MISLLHYCRDLLEPLDKKIKLEIMLKNNLISELNKYRPLHFAHKAALMTLPVGLKSLPKYSTVLTHHHHTHGRAGLNYRGRYRQKYLQEGPD